MPNTPPSTMASGSPDSAWKLADFIQQMWLSGDLFDVHFTVGREFGQTRDFAAHKFVLAARSSVLRAMFYGSLSEKCETALDIPDIHPEAFGNLLCFAYADTVENLTDDNVFATMRCADKYDIPQLMAVCSEFLVSHLNLGNCLTTLDEAIQWHAEGVVRKCLELVDVKSYEIFHSQQFTAISPEALQMILQRNTLIVNEFVLYLATEKWAAAACARNNMDPSGANLRRMLGDAVFLIRFPLLTRTQLTGGPALRGLLSESEISSIIMYHSATVKPSLPFSAERRAVPRPALDPLMIQCGDNVFIRTAEGDVWEPARVVRFTPPLQLSYIRYRQAEGRLGTVTLDRVLRGADILDHGLSLQVGTLSMDGYQDATYDSTAGSEHRAICNGQSVVVPFYCFRLLDHQVVSWKTINGKI